MRDLFIVVRKGFYILCPRRRTSPHYASDVALLLCPNASPQRPGRLKKSLHYLSSGCWVVLLSGVDVKCVNVPSQSTTKSKHFDSMLGRLGGHVLNVLDGLALVLYHGLIGAQVPADYVVVSDVLLDLIDERFYFLDGVPFPAASFGEVTAVDKVKASLDLIKSISRHDVSDEGQVEAVASALRQVRRSRLESCNKNQNSKPGKKVPRHHIDPVFQPSLPFVWVVTTALH